MWGRDHLQRKVELCVRTSAALPVSKVEDEGAQAHPSALQGPCKQSSCWSTASSRMLPRWCVLGNKISSAPECYQAPGEQHETTSGGSKASTHRFNIGSMWQIYPHLPTETLSMGGQGYPSMQYWAQHTRAGWRESSWISSMSSSAKRDPERHTWMAMGAKGWDRLLNCTENRSERSGIESRQQRFVRKMQRCMLRS